MPGQVVLSFAQSLIAPVLTTTFSMLLLMPLTSACAGINRYCASLTCSSQSTTLPSSASAIAMCVIAVVGAAPPVPMLLARREPDDVARPDLLDRPALALRKAAAGRDNQCLPSADACARPCARRARK